MFAITKLILTVSLLKLAEATYSYSAPSGSTCVYNGGTTVYYQPYTPVNFPAGSRVTYTQPCTVYYQQATTAYPYNGYPITYPANTHVSYAAGTQMTYAPGSQVWASGNSPTAMQYNTFNGNNFGIAQYPQGANTQYVGTQTATYPYTAPSTNYYNPGYSTQYGPSAPYVGMQTYYSSSSGARTYGYCNGYTGTGYPTYNSGTYNSYGKK